MELLRERIVECGAQIFIDVELLGHLMARCLLFLNVLIDFSSYLLYGSESSCCHKPLRLQNLYTSRPSREEVWDFCLRLSSCQDLQLISELEVDVQTKSAQIKKPFGNVSM